MAKLDLKGLTKQVQNAAGGVIKGISDTAQKLPDVSKIDVASAMKDVSGAVKDVTSKGQTAINAVIPKKKSEESLTEEVSEETVVDTIKPAARDTVSTEKDLFVTIEGALQIIYYLMSIDGEASSEEKDKFREIAGEFGINEDGISEEAEKTCMEAARDAESPEEYYDILHDKVGEVIASTKTEKGGIRGKLLLWDLYVLAYSDGKYSETEKRLIKYICRALHVDRVLAMEMEQSLRTIQVIETEECWLDSSDREYQKIEERKNELAERKHSVMKGIRFMISD